jgi:hypothetical protein
MYASGRPISADREALLRRLLYCFQVCFIPLRLCAILWLIYPEAQPKEHTFCTDIPSIWDFPSDFIASIAWKYLSDPVKSDIILPVPVLSRTLIVSIFPLLDTHLTLWEYSIY